MSRRKDEAGAVAVLVAMCAVVLFVLAALVVDLGLARDTRRDSQNAADASALAAANVLFPTGTCKSPVGGAPPCFADAVAAAKSYAQTNYGVNTADWATCSTPPTGFTAYDSNARCVSFDALTSAVTKVWVVMPTREVRTALGAVADTDHVTIGGAARATVQAAGANKCALCFLGSIDSGNADYTVTGGGIQVNGDLTSGPQGRWTASTIGVSGTASGGTYSPAVSHTPSFTDPLATMTLPTLTGTNFASTHSCTTSINPGVYSTLTLGNKDKCTLKSGKYVIVGKWLLGNNSVLSGTGVTLYFACGTVALPHVCTAADTTANSGWIDGKNGTITISAGAAGSTGYAIIYDRLNPQPSLGLQGNGGTSITGGVYASKAKLDFNGNSCFGFAGGPVVALGVIKANGTKSCVNVSNANDVTASSQPGAVALDR